MHVCRYFVKCLNTVLKSVKLCTKTYLVLDCGGMSSPIKGDELIIGRRYSREVVS